MPANSQRLSNANQAANSEAAPPRRSASWPLVVLAVLAILAALYVARDVLVPITLAVLLALLLRPILRRMRRLRIPDLASALVLVGGVAVLFALAVLTLAGQGQQWLSEAPAMIQKVGQMLPRKSGPIDDLQKTTQAVQDLAATDNSQEKPVPVEVQSSDAAYALVGGSGHFIGAAVIVFVLGYFLLALSETLLKQALSTRGTFLEKRNIVELVREVESGISRYLLTITIINACLGIATAAAMWALGVPNPILWGILAGLLNYVPHVGAFLCMVVLFIVGTVTHQSLAQGALVAGAFVLLTSAESYFITPVVLSKSLRLSPLAVILAILFWGWLWGIAGGLMAAPLLTIAKIVCDQFLVLRPYSALLSGEVLAENPAESTPEKTTASQVA